MINQVIPEYDIAIIGAGPGGISAALSLFCGDHPEYRVVLIDKSSFPREKICGDAVPSWVFSDLEEVSQGIHDRFLAEISPPLFRKTQLLVNRSKSLTIEWSRPGYMVPRIILDNFLLKQTNGIEGLDVMLDVNVAKIQRRDNFFNLIDKNRNVFLKARYVIGSDGAPSTVVRNLIPHFRTKIRSGSAIRTYYSNLSIQDPEISRVCYSSKYSPGYFWLFPMGPHRANVGFGMINKSRRKKNINLKDAFEYFVNEFPEVRDLLAGGTREEALKGGFLPFSKGVGNLIGPGFSLVGDAANLNDPLSGDGIRNAVKSGILLGKNLSIQSNPEVYNSLILSSYHGALKKKMQKELQFRARLVRIGQFFPFALPMLTPLGQNKFLMRWIKKWI